MLTNLRYRWYYPKCFRIQLPDSHSLFIWVFSPLWPKAWLGRKVWQNRRDHLDFILTLGPVELSLGYPIWSRLAKRK